MSAKQTTETADDFINNHDNSTGDLKRSEISSNYFKTDKSENAMLRSRIEEQGTLICFLKQRADQQLNRLSTLEEVNNELHLLRTQALEESKERLRTCNMLERRFFELSENHEDMIKIKDEYKFQCNTLNIENKSLKDQIRRQFSETIQERDKIIEDLKLQINASDQKLKSTNLQCAELKQKINELDLKHNDEEKKLKADLEKVKLSNSNLSSELNKLKQLRDEKSNQESEKFIALKKENEKLLHEVMERGKLLQERQSDVDELKRESLKKDNDMKALTADFNRKKDLVNSNLRVQRLQEERDEMESELNELKRKFEAFRVHTNNLLEQEKELNSKLRNNVIMR